MGSVYYYFIASLPYITFDGKMPMTVDVFRQECRRLLSREDYGLIERVWEKEAPLKSRNPIFDSWARFEHDLRNEFVWSRAERLNKDPLKYARGPRALDPHYAQEVQRLIKLDDLWEAEKILNKIKWQFLDELAAGHYFDIDFLLVYALKLKILQRFQEYNSPVGKDFLRELKTMPLPNSSVAGTVV
jgi:hypothetical protein